MRKALQITRNIIILGFSLVVGPNVYSQMNREPVFIALTGIAALFAVLTIIDFLLLVLKVRSKAYYYFNTVLQIIPCVIIAGLLPVAGVPILLLNIAVLVALKKDKSVDTKQIAKPEPAKK